MAVKFAGATGVITAVTVDAVPLPLSLTARTSKVWLVPLARFSTVYLNLPASLVESISVRAMSV
ncbi:MAG: hypothetical protein ERJ69_04160 [Aphanocapsa feldmannii 288cV]|nr:MAG: hypothetical protein ERJ69_04160 [Aphanocapsa feldmannii 288cV]